MEDLSEEEVNELVQRWIDRTDAINRELSDKHLKKLYGLADDRQ